METRRASAAPSHIGLPASIKPQSTSAPTAQLSPHPLTDRPSSTASLRSVPPHVGLPYIQQGSNTSSSSLMDAVVGHTDQPRPSAYVHPRSNLSNTNTRRDVSGGSGSSTSHGDSSLVKVGDQSSSEWDVLSDASARVNEGGEGDEVVKELQEKVDKRRSQLPQLESQLAALKAQIKAAEERLARVQANDGKPAVNTTATGTTA